MSSIVQILRSFTSSTSPTGTNWKEGQLAAGLQDGNKPTLWVWGGDPTTGTAPANKGWIRLNSGGVSSGTTAPAGPANGDTWVDTSVTPPLVKVYDGTNWQPVGVTASATSPANPFQGQLWVDTTGGAGSAEPKVWDGTAWQNVRTAIQQQSLDLTAQTGAADIGAAYVAAGTPAITGNIVIATWGSPAQAYILSNTAAPQTAASWTSLGGAVTFATPAEVLAGTATQKAIDPAGLQSRMTAAPNAVPANDARKLVQLNAQGKLDSSFLDVHFTHFVGGVDLTQAPASTWASGDMAIVSADALQAAINAGWGITTNAKAGDVIVYDGVNYVLIATANDLTGAVMKAGANAIAADMSMTWIAPTVMTTVLDGADNTKSQIENFNLENCVIDAGTY